MMKIQEYPFDLNKEEARIFPPEIEFDSWVFFHGTSSAYEKDIELNGLLPPIPEEELADCRKVLEIYEKMNWAGEHLGGYAVLNPFSVKYDFERSSKVFFAPGSGWALLYATRDFAGGEKKRALRIAIEDLHKYLTDERIRQNHADYLEAERQDFESRGGIAQPYSLPDLEWLSKEVNNIQSIKNRVFVPFQEHKYGIVYAFRFDPESVPDFEYNSFMGLHSTNSIPPHSIIGKIIVPADFPENDSPGQSLKSLVKYKSGLIPLVRKK